MNLFLSLFRIRYIVATLRYSEMFSCRKRSRSSHTIRHIAKTSGKTTASNMTIRLPNIPKLPACKWFSACAQVDTTDEKVIKWLKGHHNYLAQVRIYGRPFFVRVLTGGDPDTHFHLDVMSPGLFDPSESKKITHKQLQEELKVISGQKAEAFAEGAFFVPVAGVPPIIGQVLGPTVTSGLRIRMTSGSYSVDGAPIGTISWRLQKGAKDVLVELRTKRMSIILNESYLENFLEPVEAGFSAFIKADGSND